MQCKTPAPLSASQRTTYRSPNPAQPAAQTVPSATCGFPLTKAGYILIPGPQRIEQPTNRWAQAGSDSEGLDTQYATSRGKYRQRP